MARQDGCTYAGAAQLLQQVGTAEAELADTDKDAAVQLSCRRILLQLTMLKVRSVSCACMLHACTVARVTSNSCLIGYLDASLPHRIVHHPGRHVPQSSGMHWPSRRKALRICMPSWRYAGKQRRLRGGNIAAVLQWKQGSSSSPQRQASRSDDRCK